MSAKRSFIEPRIVADTELDVASQDFPLMPLVAISGAAPTGDSISDAGGVNDGIDPIAPNGTD